MSTITTAQASESTPAPGRPPSVVWIVNQYAGAPQYGAGYRHYFLGRQLAAQGHTVVLLSGSYSHQFRRQPTTTGTFTLEEVDGLSYCWVALPRYGRAVSAGRVLSMAAFALQLARLPADLLPRPDAILVSSPPLFPIVVAAHWARRFGARLVFEVRDIWPLTLQELGGFHRRHPLVVLMQWFEDFAYREADRVVSVLPGAGRHMRARGMPAEKFAYVPNGISLNGAHPAGPAPDAVLAAVRPGVFTVGYVGTLGTANALETLIDAGRLLDPDEATIVIAGLGPEGDRLRERAAGVPNVAFVGPIPKAQVPAALGLFDACYLGLASTPLWRFGVSPNKLYDYMAAGRPVLFAADAGNQPVDEADCGRTVAPEDPAAVAEAIRSLAACSPAERARLGANARAHVEAHHDHAVLADQLAAVLVDDIR